MVRRPGGCTTAVLKFRGREIALRFRLRRCRHSKKGTIGGQLQSEAGCAERAGLKGRKREGLKPQGGGRLDRRATAQCVARKPAPEGARQFRASGSKYLGINDLAAFQKGGPPLLIIT